MVLVMMIKHIVEPYLINYYCLGIVDFDLARTAFVYFVGYLFIVYLFYCKLGV